MRTCISSILIGFLLLAGTLTAQEIHTQQNAANYLNESNSTTGWSVPGSGTIISSNSTEAFLGLYCIKIEAASDGWRRASYTFPLEIGKEYQIKFHAKSASTSGPGFFVWEGFSNFSAVDISSTSWTEYVFNLTADAATAILKVYSGNPSVAGDAIYMDNISIKAVGSDLTSNSEVRINAGGPAITHDGKQFEADQYVTGGGTYTNSSAQVPELYRTEHSGSARTFDYAIPIGNGTYDVNLHFAEIYWGATGGGTGSAGKRIFDVTIENNLEMDNYDIYADVGPETPIVKKFTVEVIDEILNINLSSLSAVGGVDQAKLSAIEVVPAASETGGIWAANGSNIYYDSGNVGIGTTPQPEYELAVNGAIHSKEVKVDLVGWPDYVFDKDYELPTLEEIENHIKENGHLMNIPSAKEVEASGIELGKINKLLLEKIEELTLHIIEQSKNQKRLEARLKLLKTEN